VSALLPEMWQLHPPCPGDKDLIVTGPADVYIRVDYDDVNTANVLLMVKRMVRTLNEHFTDDHGEMMFGVNIGKLKFEKD